MPSDEKQDKVNVGGRLRSRRTVDHAISARHVFYSDTVPSAKPRSRLTEEQRSRVRTLQSIMGPILGVDQFSSIELAVASFVGDCLPEFQILAAEIMLEALADVISDRMLPCHFRQTCGLSADVVDIITKSNQSLIPVYGNLCQIALTHGHRLHPLTYDHQGRDRTYEHQGVQYDYQGREHQGGERTYREVLPTTKAECCYLSALLNRHDSLVEVEFALFASFAMRQRCECCGHVSHLLKKCAGCKSVYYCDNPCQRKHWKEHKAVCRTTTSTA